MHTNPDTPGNAGSRLDTVADVQVFRKLMTCVPPPDAVRITVHELDYLLSTVDYVMDGWCGYDMVRRNDRNRTVLAYVKGRGPDADVWLDPDFAQQVGLESCK